ncbi:MAG TPA: hypothetical protein VFZ87_06420, partial [Gemmatimonadales bacterium]
QVDLSRIGAPVLAIYAVPGTAEVMVPWWQTRDASAHDRARKMYSAISGVTTRLRSDFRKRSPAPVPWWCRAPGTTSS